MAHFSPPLLLLHLVHSISSSLQSRRLLLHLLLLHLLLLHLLHSIFSFSIFSFSISSSSPSRPQEAAEEGEAYVRAACTAAGVQEHAVGGAASSRWARLKRAR